MKVATPRMNEQSIGLGLMVPSALRSEALVARTELSGERALLKVNPSPV
jgi:hypothetical protein